MEYAYLLKKNSFTEFASNHQRLLIMGEVSRDRKIILKPIRLNDYSRILGTVDPKLNTEAYIIRESIKDGQQFM